ncbi:MAG: hypothetical protein JXR63_01095 [Spirochaetales bacterium]|nr:hypothetical protein [Spirochaetales bacterium]
MYRYLNFCVFSFFLVASLFSCSIFDSLNNDVTLKLDSEGDSIYWGSHDNNSVVLNMGRVDVDTCKEQIFRITSQESPIRIDGFTFSGEAFKAVWERPVESKDQAFYLAGKDGTSIGEGYYADQVEFKVTFCPISPISFNGKLIIFLNNTKYPKFTINLLGEGVSSVGSNDKPIFKLREGYSFFIKKDQEVSEEYLNQQKFNGIICEDVGGCSLISEVCVTTVDGFDSSKDAGEIAGELRFYFCNGEEELELFAPVVIVGIDLPVIEMVGDLCFGNITYSSFPSFVFTRVPELLIDEYYFRIFKDGSAVDGVNQGPYDWGDMLTISHTLTLPLDPGVYSGHLAFVHEGINYESIFNFDVRGELWVSNVIPAGSEDYIRGSAENPFKPVELSSSWNIPEGMVVNIVKISENFNINNYQGDSPLTIKGYGASPESTSRITLQSSRNVVIEGIKFHLADAGIDVLGSSHDITIRTSWFEKVTNSAINIDSSYGVLVTQNYFKENSTVFNLKVDSSGAPVIIENNITQLNSRLYQNFGGSGYTLYRYNLSYDDNEFFSSSSPSYHIYNNTFYVTTRPSSSSFFSGPSGYNIFNNAFISNGVGYDYGFFSASHMNNCLIDLGVSDVTVAKKDSDKNIIFVGGGFKYEELPLKMIGGQSQADLQSTIFDRELLLFKGSDLVLKSLNFPFTADGFKEVATNFVPVFGNPMIRGGDSSELNGNLASLPKVTTDIRGIPIPLANGNYTKLDIGTTFSNDTPRYSPLNSNFTVVAPDPAAWHYVTSSAQRGLLTTGSPSLVSLGSGLKYVPDVSPYDVFIYQVVYLDVGEYAAHIRFNSNTTGYNTNFGLISIVDKNVTLIPGAPSSHNFSTTTRGPYLIFSRIGVGNPAIPPAPIILEEFSITP